MNPKYIILNTLILTILLSAELYGQNHINLNEIHLKNEGQNITVKPLDHDSLASTFIIEVENEVKAHKHELHTEVVIVLEGKGRMTLDSDTFSVKKDDYIFIPRGTVHSVVVEGSDLLKVLSIQSPFFEGKDRIFE